MNKYEIEAESRNNNKKKKIRLNSNKKILYKDTFNKVGAKIGAISSHPLTC